MYYNSNTRLRDHIPEESIEDKMMMFHESIGLHVQYKYRFCETLPGRHKNCHHNLYLLSAYMYAFHAPLFNTYMYMYH